MDDNGCKSANVTMEGDTHRLVSGEGGTYIRKRLVKMNRPNHGKGRHGHNYNKLRINAKKHSVLYY